MSFTFLSFEIHSLRICKFSLPALCGSGAKNLMENGEAFLQIIVQCMDRSHPHSVQVEGFRLAQCLVVIFVTLFFLEDNLLGYLDLYDDALTYCVSFIVREMKKTV